MNGTSALLYDLKILHKGGYLGLSCYTVGTLACLAYARIRDSKIVKRVRCLPSALFLFGLAFKPFRLTKN